VWEEVKRGSRFLGRKWGTTSRRAIGFLKRACCESNLKDEDKYAVKRGACSQNCPSRRLYSGAPVPQKGVQDSLG